MKHSMYEHMLLILGVYYKWLNRPCGCYCQFHNVCALGMFPTLPPANWLSNPRHLSYPRHLLAPSERYRLRYLMLILSLSSNNRVKHTESVCALHARLILTFASSHTPALSSVVVRAATHRLPTQALPLSVL